MVIFHMNIAKNFSIEIFKTCFTCHYFLKVIMKKFVQLSCIVICSEVRDYGPIFSGIVHRQERGSFVCKHR